MLSYLDTYLKFKLKGLFFHCFQECNRIQRKSIKKLRDYFDDQSKYLDIPRHEQRLSLRDLTLGEQRASARFLLTNEGRFSSYKGKKGVSGRQATKAAPKKKTKKKKDKTIDDSPAEVDEQPPLDEEESEKKKAGETVDTDELSTDEEETDESSLEEEYMKENENDVEDDGLDEDAYDEKRKYEEEISVLEYDVINFIPEIFIKLHNEVLWFEKPFPVTWNSEKNYWSTSAGMKNIQFNEEKRVSSVDK